MRMISYIGLHNCVCMHLLNEYNIIYIERLAQLHVTRPCNSPVSRSRDGGARPRCGEQAIVR